MYIYFCADFLLINETKRANEIIRIILRTSSECADKKNLISQEEK